MQPLDYAGDRDHCNASPFDVGESSDHLTEKNSALGLRQHLQGGQEHDAGVKQASQGGAGSRDV